MREDITDGVGATKKGVNVVADGLMTKGRNGHFIEASCIEDDVKGGGQAKKGGRDRIRDSGTRKLTEVNKKETLHGGL